MHGIGRRFSDPIGIAFNNTNDKVYVLNDGNGRIAILNSDLLISLLGTLEKPTSGKGQFRYPHGIACDSTGNVYVAGTLNNCIQVFTAERGLLEGLVHKGRGNWIGHFTLQLTLVMWCMSVRRAIVASLCSPQRVGL